MPDRNARVWTGTEWESISSPVSIPNAVATFQSAAPSSPVTGQVWIDSDDDSVYVWNGSSWDIINSVSKFGGDTITVSSGTTVPLTIQNNGTGDSFVVNDESSDSTPFVINSAGNVGINESSPVSLFEITKSTSSGTVENNAFIVLSNRNNTNSTFITSGIVNDTYRDIANPHYSAGMWFVREPFSSNNSSSGSIVFGTGTNVDAGLLPAERMRINSSGIITKPNQPSFCVSYSGSSVANQTPILWNVVSGSGRFNNGSHYNSTNGRFTAPVSGRYFFFVQVHHPLGAGNPNGFAYFDLRINGVLASRFIGSWTSDLWVELNHSNIYTLNANDYVDVIVFDGQNQWMGATRPDHNRFSGFLIG